MNHSARQPCILMCRPDYFGIEYEINPWMKRERGSELDRACAQWTGLYNILVQLGVDVRLIPPVKGLPDLVFTANAALIHRRKAYLSQFRHAARKGETAVNAAWFAEQGFECIEMPAEMDFEGAGDALFCGETLFGGYIIRSSARALQWVASEVGCRVIPLQLVDDRYYHLDTCFCPVNPTTAIYYPPAFDEYGRRALLEHVPTLIPVSPDEAAAFACNAVVVGRHVVLNTGCPRLEAALRGIGFETHATPLGEFLKSGGSAKCLTLRLDGEDAAIWP